MKEKMVSAERKTLEMAAKYICNLRDGLCPMVVENYRCLSACGPETQPWRCWIDHFQTVSGAKAAKTADTKHVREFSSRIRPRREQRGIHRPAADLEPS